MAIEQILITVITSVASVLTLLVPAYLAYRQQRKKDALEGRREQSRADVEAFEKAIRALETVIDRLSLRLEECEERNGGRGRPGPRGAAKAAEDPPPGPPETP